MATRTLTDLRRDDRGAVLVEFIVAFLPLMTVFAFFMQLEQMATASLVLKHAAVVGARAAAVIANENRNTPDAADSNNRDVVERAVREALGPWGTTMTNLQVQVRDSSNC